MICEICVTKIIRVIRVIRVRLLFSVSYIIIRVNPCYPWFKRICVICEICVTKNIRNYLARAIDVRDDAWQPHCTCLQYRVREALTIAWEHEAVCLGIAPHEVVASPLTRHDDVRVLLNHPVRLLRHRIKVLLEESHEVQPYLRSLLIQSAERLHQFVDTLVTHDSTDE